MHTPIATFFVNANQTLEETIRIIQRGNEGIALLVDGEQRLVSTVTDGDIRRALLKKIAMHTPVQVLLSFRPLNYPVPITASVATPKTELIRLMRERVVRQIPLLDRDGRVVELALLSALLEDDTIGLAAVVMAGGMGQRLLPLTMDIPKPMLPLHERPILERTIEQLRRSGIRKVHVTTHYRADVITEHFGNGDAFGMDIQYVNEEQPLGTAGALGIMEPPKEPTLIINGDIVTGLDFRAMHDFHRANGADMSVGVRVYEFNIPYGVIETDDILVTQCVEKPTKSVMVNAGIYLLEPSIFQFVPRGKHFNMTELIDVLLHNGRRVVSFPIQEYWLDVGQHHDYQRAQEDAKNGRIR